jgi:hypothetical protein
VRDLKIILRSQKIASCLTAGRFFGIIKQDMENNNEKKWHRLEVFFEFLIFGIVVGVVEDLIAVEVVADVPITWHVVGIIVLIAIPFAMIGEILVDRIDFVEIFRKIFRKDKQQ